MKITDRAEEILERLWANSQQDPKTTMELGIARIEPEIEELSKSGHIKLSKDTVTLTEKGKNEGRKIVRRHRLAERLFTDVLDVKKELIHPLSCQFEHLLHEGIEDNICTLLGHPKTCPHGQPMPEGECCRKFKDQTKKIVSTLSSLEPGQKGKVAYIHTKDHRKLQRLMAMGILPGMSISLIRKSPSCVFQLGQSQFAMDKELAENVCVRITR